MCLDLSVHVFAFLLFVHLPQDRVLQALCYIHVLTTGLGVAGFVLILCMYFPQDWVLQSLCYYCTCTYHRTGCCRLCVNIVHVLSTRLGVAGFVLLLYIYLPQDWVLQALCYVHVLTTGLCAAGFVLCPCTYHWTGCCWLCVTVVHALTTGLGAAGFVLLLSMYLRQDWVLQVWLALSMLSLLVSPTQLSPPLAGAGLLQSRVRVCVPHPHVTLQVLQVFQLPQFPFTGTTVKTGTDAHKANEKW